MYRIIVVCLIILMPYVAAFGAEIRLLPGEVLPEIYDIKIQAKVSYESESSIYTYIYTITNPTINTGAIDDIDIDIKKPAGSVALIREGLRYGYGYLRYSSEDIFARSPVPLIPVGLSAPNNWIAGISVRSTAGWGAAEETSLIYPGSSMSGFEMNSRGLPGIRQVTLFPDFKQTPVPEATKEDVERIKAIRKKITFTTKTIGPTAPPADFKPIAFLDYIISLKHEAFNLGWIKNAGIEQSLDAKLDNAKKKLEQGNITAAKNIFEAFMNEIEAQGCVTYEDCSSGKHISPEAYALLKYNVQYLIGKL